MDKRKKIFIVEDESIIALTLESTLESLGFEVIGIAANGIQSMQFLKTRIPDLILMDINLGGNIDGIELAKMINNLYRIPIIFLTAYSMPEIVEKAKETYPYGFIVKPFKTNDLRIAITLALNKWEFEKKLDASEKKYRKLVETINEGIFQFNIKDLSTQFINSSFCDMMEISYEEVMAGKHIQRIRNIALQLIEEPEDKYEICITTQNGNEKYFSVSTGTIFNEIGEIQSALSIWHDVTEREKQSIQLTKFYNTIEQAKELITITDKSGKIEYANPTFCQITGYSLAELIGENMRLIKSGHHNPSEYQEIWKSLLRGETVKKEFINKKKNGELLYEEKVMSPLKDKSGEIVNFISTGRDITEQKKNLEKIELLNTIQKNNEKRQAQIRSESVIQGQDEERKRIARDIHDGIGQILTAAIINLEMPAISKLNKSKKYKELDNVYSLVKETITEVRKIAHNLSPSLLNDFGLLSAINTSINRFNNESGKIKIELETNLTNERFNSKIEINVYRIIQEIFNNAIKHAKCTLIKIQLFLKNDKLTVSISDNGIGFNYDDDKLFQVNELSKFGIRNIKERALILGSSLKLQSQPNKGTIINFEVKLNLEND